jgi:UDP-N-acetyl-D-galactosamine dehydrogenase
MKNKKVLVITPFFAPEVGKKIDDLYNSVIIAGTHLAPTIKAAET